MTILLKRFVPELLGQPCDKCDDILVKLVTSCSKLVDNFGQAVRTQLVDGLSIDLLQLVNLPVYCMQYKFS